MTTKSTGPKTKAKGKTWHQKIAANRGKSWLDATREGRLDAIRNPSLLRLVRTKKGMLQSELAKALKMSESTLGQIERGKRPVKRSLASTIANHLGMTSTKLFKPVGNKFVALIQKSTI